MSAVRVRRRGSFLLFADRTGPSSPGRPIPKQPSGDASPRGHLPARPDELADLQQERDDLKQQLEMQQERAAALIKDKTLLARRIDEVGFAHAWNAECRNVDCGPLGDGGEDHPVDQSPADY